MVGGLRNQSRDLAFRSPTDLLKAGYSVGKLFTLHSDISRNVCPMSIYHLAAHSRKQAVFLPKSTGRTDAASTDRTSDSSIELGS